MVCYLRAVGGRASGGIGRLALPASLRGGFWNMRRTDRKASADTLRACILCVGLICVLHKIPDAFTLSSCYSLSIYCQAVVHNDEIVEISKLCKLF